jgi:hypothetical protein
MNIVTGVIRGFSAVTLGKCGETEPKLGQGRTRPQPMYFSIHNHQIIKRYAV